MNSQFRSSQSDRFQLSSFKLHALLDFTEVFNQGMKPNLLLERFQQIIGEELQIDRILFYILRDDTWHCVLNVNCNKELIAQLELDITSHLKPYRRTMMVSSVTGSLLLSMGIDVVIPLQQHDKIEGYVLLGCNEDSEVGVSPLVKHLAFAQSLATVSFVALQNLHNFSLRLRQEEVHQQLKVAKQLQQKLIPRTEHLPAFPNIEIAMLYRPYYDIGGDYFDILKLSENIMGFCIADVAGKGISASLQMMSLRAHFRALMNPDISLCALAKRLNRVIYEELLEDSFITFFTGRFHIKEQRLEYLNAGHNAALIWPIGANEPMQLTSNTMALGMLPELSIVQEEEIEVPLESLVIAYTDGLVEYRNHGVEYCNLNIISQNIAECTSPKALVQRLEKILEAHAEDKEREVFDDVSVLSFMVHKAF